MESFYARLLGLPGNQADKRTSTPLALLWRGETLGRGTLHQHTLVWWFFQCCGLAATELLLVLREAPTAVIDVLVHTLVPFALR